MKEEKYVITVDGGTTKTRLCAWDFHGNILKTVLNHIGARDSALNGSSKIWKDTIKNMIRKTSEELHISNEKLSAVIISGMLTSDLGVYEIPHLEAPITLRELSESVTEIRDEELAFTKIFLITGIKNGGSLLEDPKQLRKFDVMRGEETEVFAINEEIGGGRNTVYILPGSHNKFVYVDGAGTILGCKTTLSGELLTTVTKDTILSASLNREFLVDKDYSEELVLQGYYMARDEGENRAFFFARILNQFCGWTAEQLQNYVLGVVLESDLETLNTDKYFVGEEEPRIVVVGNGVLCQGFYSILKKEKGDKEILFIKDHEKPFAAVGAYLMAKKLLQNA